MLFIRRSSIWLQQTLSVEPEKNGCEKRLNQSASVPLKGERMLISSMQKNVGNHLMRFCFGLRKKQ